MIDLTKKPQLVKECKYKIGNVVQCRQTGRMGIISSILFFYFGSSKDYTLKVVGFDGKFYDFENPMILTQTLDEYMEIR